MTSVGASRPDPAVGTSFKRGPQGRDGTWSATRSRAVSGWCWVRSYWCSPGTDGRMTAKHGLTSTGAPPPGAVAHYRPAQGRVRPGPEHSRGSSGRGAVTPVGACPARRTGHEPSRCALGSPVCGPVPAPCSARLLPWHGSVDHWQPDEFDQQKRAYHHGTGENRRAACAGSSRLVRGARAKRRRQSMLAPSVSSRPLATPTRWQTERANPRPDR
jgi:hypothetical protein